MVLTQKEARASHASSQNDGAYGKYNTGASHTFKEARKPNPDEKKGLPSYQISR